MQISDQDLAGKIWEYMRIDQPLERADIIIGLGSFYKGTADWCAKLWHDGLAPKIIFCGNTGLSLIRAIFLRPKDIHGEHKSLG